MTTPSTHTTKDGATVTEHHSDRDPMEHADPDVLLPTSSGGTLREHGSLTDAEGDDVREYTGEPVETDEGWVIPQAQTIGAVDDPADSLADSDASPPADAGPQSDDAPQTGPDADKPRPSEDQAEANREVDPPA